jgi:hypothetical protein
MERPIDPATKALAFANGLRKNTLTTGRRWAQWPRGPAQLAAVIERIDAIVEAVQRARAIPNDADVAGAIADLRTILEWTTYQSASLATARALIVARKTRTFAERFGLLADGAPNLAVLVDSDASLIDNVRAKNGFMIELAARAPHLRLPPPLVSPESLAPAPKKPPGRLALIAQLTKSTKK